MVVRVALGVAAGLALLTSPVRAGDNAGVDATVVAQPLDVDLTFSRDEVAVGERLWAHAVVTNQGHTTVEGVTAALRMSEVIAIDGGAVREVGDLTPRRRALVRWRVCPREAGAHVGLVHVDGRVETGQVVQTESPARLLSVTEGNGLGRPRTCPED